MIEIQSYRNDIEETVRKYYRYMERIMTGGSHERQKSTKLRRISKVSFWI